MALKPLFLQGNLLINGTDFSDIVESFTLRVTRDTVEKAATFGKKKDFRAGGDAWELEIRYDADTATPSTLTTIFYAAINDPVGTITFSGTFADGAVSATNPRWYGTAVVTSLAMGGDVNTWATDTVTFPVQAPGVLTSNSA